MFDFSSDNMLYWYYQPGWDQHGHHDNTLNKIHFLISLYSKRKEEDEKARKKHHTCYHRFPAQVHTWNEALKLTEIFNSHNFLAEKNGGRYAYFPHNNTSENLQIFALTQAGAKPVP